MLRGDGVHLACPSRAGVPTLVVRARSSLGGRLFGVWRCGWLWLCWCVGCGLVGVGPGIHLRKEEKGCAYGCPLYPVVATQTNLHSLLGDRLDVSLASGLVDDRGERRFVEVFPWFCVWWVVVRSLAVVSARSFLCFV